jgi:RNA polymerase sigma-70 factor (ECF subfamily)
VDSLHSRDLILQLQGGSLEALGALYDRYNRLVFRTALAITGDPEAAADLLQDVFLRLHRFAERVDPARPLEPWLYRVTVNQACTWVKRRRWLQPIEDLAEWLIGETKNSPPRWAEMREESRAIEAALASLPLAQRTVIVMFYINDLPVQEIAEVLDLPQGTVKSRLHYGRKALKAHMVLTEDGLVSDVQYEFT